MQKAIEYIKNNWQKGKSLKEIAHEFGVDPANLERAFKNSRGTPVKHFIDEKRKESVLAYLRKDDMYGYEIGKLLGFTNDRSFYRWIKYSFGIPYRELLMKQNKKKEK